MQNRHSRNARGVTKIDRNFWILQNYEIIAEKCIFFAIAFSPRRCSKNENMHSGLGAVAKNVFLPSVALRFLLFSWPPMWKRIWFRKWLRFCERVDGRFATPPVREWEFLRRVCSCPRTGRFFKNESRRCEFGTMISNKFSSVALISDDHFQLRAAHPCFS